MPPTFAQIEWKHLVSLASLAASTAADFQCVLRGCCPRHFVSILSLAPRDTPRGPRFLWIEPGVLLTLGTRSYLMSKANKGGQGGFPREEASGKLSEVCTGDDGPELERAGH